MSSLSNIRSHLSAVENIKKITTSMEMVASARFRKAQDRARQAKFYIHTMQGILEKLNAASTDLTHPFFIQKNVNRTGVVIVGSDRGLCGAYNSTIFSAADRFINAQKEVELTVLGRRAIQYYQRRKWKISSQLSEWSGKITLEQIKNLSDLLIQSFLSGAVDIIWLIYTKFHSLMNREVVIEQFLPVHKPPADEKRSLNYIFEPTIEEIYEKILPNYCMTKIEAMLNEAYASELVARIFSMKAAAKNAEEMIDHLILMRNKVRQAAITREMLETTAAVRE